MRPFSRRDVTAEGSTAGNWKKFSNNSEGS
jgi:hypothetical protein